MQKLLIATNNQGKLVEYRQLLSDVPYEILGLREAGVKLNVEEKGRSYEENSRLKAVTYAAKSGLLTLADDSGLEINGLGGEPGIRSARYLGEAASFKQRFEYIISKLKGIPPERRTARFRCIIAIAAPKGEVIICEGVCEGLISLKPKGEQGFGYDPIFYLPEYKKTMAELPMETKNRVSHRGKAALKARQILTELAQGN